MYHNKIPSTLSSSTSSILTIMSYTLEKNKIWKTERYLFLGIICFALFGLYFFNAFFPFLSLGLGIFIIWHYYQLYLLSAMILSGKKIKPPTWGIWAILLQRLDHLQQRWQQYRKSKRRIYTCFQQTMRIFPDALLIIDEHWHIIWHNPALEKLLGLHWNNKDKYLPDLIPHPVLKEYIDKHHFETPLILESPTDHSHILSLQFSPFFNNSLHLLLIIRDITSTYRLDQTRKDFIANVSHELKTPLTVLHGFLEPMQQAVDEIPPHWLDTITLMYQQTQRMNDIVHDLLLLSSLEATQISPPHLLDMPQLLQACIAEAQLLADTKQHPIHTSIDNNLYLQAEKKALRYLILNLLYNAIKHTLPGCDIYIHWYYKNGQAYLDVKDTGEGIAACHISRLTERFYRVENSRSRDKGGTGLGLAIVKHILLQYQAQLHISSQIGRGSTFSCEFPGSMVQQRREFLSMTHQ